MIKAAGIMFLVGETTLFLRRGNGGDHPNEWAFAGGKIEEGETAEEAAIREVMEETSFEVKPDQLRLWTRAFAPASAGMPALEGQPIAQADDCDFTTFIVRLEEQFTPTLCDENDGFAWAPLRGAPQPLHPGCQIALDRIGMNELDVARAMAEGCLSSPQRYGNMTMFAMRITGTGAAYRTSLKEYVWRDPSIYLNEDFLARCNGLLVLWEHPEKGLLNSKEHRNRTIGSIFLPYLRADRPDEVWGIAKIYDDEAIRETTDEFLSTSPTVQIRPVEGDRIELADGSVVLIEGDPFLLDHVAVCPQGVWDKGGDPTGVDSITAMADNDALVLADAATAKSAISNLDILRAHAAALLVKAQFCATSNRQRSAS